MPEIGTSGAMSGMGNRALAVGPKQPRPSSTLPTLPLPPPTRDGGYRGISCRPAPSPATRRNAQNAVQRTCLAAKILNENQSTP